MIDDPSIRSSCCIVADTDSRIVTLVEAKDLDGELDMKHMATESLYKLPLIRFIFSTYIINGM